MEIAIHTPPSGPAIRRLDDYSVHALCGAFGIYENRRLVALAATLEEALRAVMSRFSAEIDSRNARACGIVTYTASLPATRRAAKRIFFTPLTATPWSFLGSKAARVQPIIFRNKQE